MNPQDIALARQAVQIIRDVVLSEEPPRLVAVIWCTGAGGLRFGDDLVASVC